MKLGSVDVPGPIAGFSTARKGALSDATYDGNVGSGALKRFVVTFDYGGRTMFLKPTTRLDPDTSQFDRGCGSIWQTEVCKLWISRKAAPPKRQDSRLAT
jgi:hypothetical protein